MALVNDTAGTSKTDLITSDGTLKLTGVEAAASVEYSIDGGTTWLGWYRIAASATSGAARIIFEVP